MLCDSVIAGAAWYSSQKAAGRLFSMSTSDLLYSKYTYVQKWINWWWTTQCDM